MLASRRIRVAVGIFMLAAVWNIFWTRATSHVSTQAVVDAPLVTVRAPTDGTILTASPRLGSGVSPMTTLLELAPRDTSPEDVLRLHGDIRAAMAEEDALSLEILATREMTRLLQVRAKAEREQEIRYLTQRLNEALEIRRQANVEWDLAAEDLERTRQLSATGRVSEVNVRAKELELEIADAKIAEADARASAIRTELDAIDRGLASPAGTGRRDSSYDRIDDMHVHLNDLLTRRAIVAGRRAGLEMRLPDTDPTAERTTQFLPRAATNGVVWRASPPAGASAVQGTTLTEVLDCRRRFVEVVLTESIFEELDVGTEAFVQLKGSDERFPASVAFRRAGGVGSALTGQPDASPLNEPQSSVRVYLTLPPADTTDPSVVSRFCDVGRTAEVTIPRPGWAERFPSISRVIFQLSQQTKDIAGTLLSDASG